MADLAPGWHSAQSGPVVITADSFPTPPFALWTNDEAERSAVARFSEDQAREANKLLARLDQLGADESLVDSVFETVYRECTQWRHRLAVEMGSPVAPGFLVPIGDDMRAHDGPNCDPVGNFTSAHEGGAWNPATNRWDGGRPTPASDICMAMGEIVRARCAAQQLTDGMLQNQVTVSGREPIAGNRIYVGAECHPVAEEFRQRYAGRTDRHVEIGDDLYFVVNGKQDDRRRLRQVAVSVLSDLERERRRGGGRLDANNPDLQDRFALAAYCLFQGPEFKRGSDATTRVLLASSYTHLFGQAPRLPESIDLLAYVQDQNQFITGMRTALQPVNLGTADRQQPRTKPWKQAGSTVPTTRPQRLPY